MSVKSDARRMVAAERASEQGWVRKEESCGWDQVRFSGR